MYKKTWRILAKSENNSVLGRRPHFIFSVEEPRYEQKLKMDHDKAVNFLRQKGYKVEEMGGRYGGLDERSIVVHDVPEESIGKLHQFAKDLGQESSIHSDGSSHSMLYHGGENAGMHVRGQGTNFHKNPPEDYFSTLSDGTIFTHNFNMDEWHPSETNGVKKSEDVLMKAPIMGEIDPDDEDWHYANSVGHVLNPSGGFSYSNKATEKMKDSLFHHVIERHYQDSQEPGGTRKFFDHIYTTDEEGEDPIANLSIQRTSKGKHRVNHSIVEPSHRGRGFGSMMYQRALEHHGDLESDESVSPEAHRVWEKMSKKPNVQGRLGEYPGPSSDRHAFKFIKKSEDDDSRYLEHYSRHKDLAHIDPDHTGSGVDRTQRAAANRQSKFSFYYPNNYESPEPFVTNQAQSKYKVKLDPNHKVFDAKEHGSDIVNQSKNASGALDIDAFVQNLKTAGYHGFKSRPQGVEMVAMFDKLPVYSEEPVQPFKVKKSEIEKGVKTPSKFMGLKRLKQIKQDHNIGAGGNEYSEGELKDAIVQRKISDAERTVREAKRREKELASQHEGGGALPPPFVFKKSESLEKGAMQRKFKFRPQDDVGEDEAENVDLWQQDSFEDGRKKMGNMHPNAKMRALNKLAAKTKMRTDKDGKRHFLLHRGVGASEALKTYRKKGAFIKEINNPDFSSWTYDKKFADNFGADYGGGAQSAWIHEDNITHMPNAYGDVSHGGAGENKMHGEGEVIVGPHKSRMASHNEVNTEIHPNTLDEAISARGKMGGSWLGREQSDKSFRERVVKPRLKNKKLASSEHDVPDLLKNEYKPPKINLNPEHGKKIADAYHNMKHDPDHPDVQEAYGALINETKKQYQDILDSGIKLTPIKPGQENPYKNSKELHHDIENNKHMYYFPTDQGFGSSDNEYSNHPMLQPTELEIGGQKLLANDLFRIVHDINGHHHGGRTTFGPKGEHKAFLHHKTMYSPMAQRALASETLGQNSWVNFGPHGEANRRDPANTIYADQKAGLLPNDILEGNWHADETPQASSPMDLVNKPIKKSEKKFKYQPKKGDTVHLSHGITDSKRGGEKVHTDKKYVVHNESKGGYRQSHWVVPEGEKDTSKGRYHRSDRLHPVKKFEVQLKKDVGALKFPGLKDITTRPDQEINSISTDRQADIATKQIVEREKRVRPEAAEAVEQEAGRAVRSLVQKKPKNILGKPKKAKGTFEGIEGDRQAAKSQIREAKARQEDKDFSEPGAQGFLVEQRVPDQKDLGFVPERHAGGPVQQHEGHHHLFSEVSRKYGPSARYKLVNHLLKELPGQDIEDMKDHLRFTYGYDHKDSNFNEEVLNHARDILVSPKSRESYLKFLEEKHGPANTHDNRRTMARVKSGWRKVLNSSKKVTPETFQAEVIPFKSKLTASEKAVIDMHKATSFRSAIMAGLATGAMATSSNVQAGMTQPETPVQNTITHDQQVPENNKNHILNAIQFVESSGGKNTNHERLPQDSIHRGERAFGKYGLTPLLIRETIGQHKDLSRKYNSLQNLQGDQFHEQMQQHPELEEIIASRHYDRLSRKFGHDHQKIGYAWLNGITGTMKALKRGDDISDHWHVQKITNAYNKAKSGK